MARTGAAGHRAGGGARCPPASAAATGRTDRSDRPRSSAAGAASRGDDHRRRTRRDRPARRARRQRARGRRPEVAGALVVPGRRRRSRAGPRSCAIDRGEASAHERPRSRSTATAVLLALDRALALQARIDDARTLVADAGGAHPCATDAAGASRRCGSSARHPLGFDVVAAEVRAAWRCCGITSCARERALAGVVLRRPGADGLALHQGFAADAGSAQRAYGRPVAASLLIALMSLWWLAPDPPTLFYEALLVLVPIPAAMVARRALAGAHSADALRTRVGHGAASVARRDRRERDCRSGAAAAAGDQHCRAGRHRPAPRAIAAGIAAGESGRRARRWRCS